jgi:hypothetical protein
MAPIVDSHFDANGPAQCLAAHQFHDQRRAFNAMNLCDVGVIQPPGSWPRAGSGRSAPDPARPLRSMKLLWYSVAIRDMPFRGNDPTRKRAVAVFLKNNAGVPYCDECLRTALQISRTRLNEKGMAENADRLGLVRDWNVCKACGERRVTTKA